MSEEMSSHNEILSAEEITLARADGLGVTLRVRGGEAHHGVRVLNPAPLDGRLRFVCFTDRKGKEIAMVRVDETLSPEARAIIEEELARRYLRAVIRRIFAISIEGRTSYWQVETDRGRRNFMVSNFAENVRQLSPVRILITDAHENRLEIVNVDDLDARSRKVLDRIL